jgi:drug/metabolite transporter (DMT)-like permease
VSQRAKAEILLVIVTLIWGATFVVVKGALRDASPLPFLAVRFTLAGVLLLLVMSRGLVDRQALVPGFVLGIFLFAGYLFQTTGLLYTTPSKAAFITGSAVILVPFMQVLHGFRLRGATIAGALLGLGGIYFLVLPSGLHAVNRGDILTLFGALSFAVHIVLVGTYTRRVSFRHLVPVQILAVGLLAAAALPLNWNFRLVWTVGLILALLVTATLATGFAFAVQNWAQQFTPPAHTALIFALEPVFAALTSRLVMGEKFGGKVFLGAALILAGMVVSEVWGSTTPSPVEG